MLQQSPMCRNGDIPILVFNMAELDNQSIVTMLSEQNIGTLVPGDESDV